MEVKKTVVHWFRRDLRLDDNMAIFYAARARCSIVPFFCLDTSAPDILPHHPPSRAFIDESVFLLGQEIGEKGGVLVVREGDTVFEIVKLVKETGANAVYWNRAAGAHASAMDRRLEAAGRENGFETRNFSDFVLHEPSELKTSSGSPYTIFTPYFRKWIALPKPPPFFYGDNILFAVPKAAHASETFRAIEGKQFFSGGSKNAKERLACFVENGLADYFLRRDFPNLDGTSMLSPHLRWGTVSARTVFHACSQKLAVLRSASSKKGAETFLKELAWRDFFNGILESFPHVERGAFRPQYSALSWENSAEHFDAWKLGRTGFPIVDAAMRQLESTGWMHNRLRMVVAMFLAKDLLVDWRWGERHFMARLADGDLAANNGGWQWSAGTGTDAAPYFRIFNPLEQGKKWDPQAVFIKRYVPELKPFTAAEIHSPSQQSLWQAGYPEPVVEHAAQRRKAIAMFRRAS